MQLVIRVKIVMETFTLQPRKQSPFCLCQVSGLTAANGIRCFPIFRNMTIWFRSIERQRLVFTVAELPNTAKVCGIPAKVLPGVNSRSIRQVIAVDVIAASAEVVVCVPGVGGSKHGNFCLRCRRSYHPREAEEATVFAF